MTTVSVGSTRKPRVLLIVLFVVLVLLVGGAAGIALLGNSAGGNVLTQNLSEPVGNATSARVEINAGTGNLVIDRLSSGEPVLASGTLQYQENQGQPIRSVDTSSGQATFTLKASGIGKPGSGLPWEACNGETDWQVHLNPAVQSDITAHSDGGNVKLDLTGMVVTRIAADTGGGNVDVVVPQSAAALSVTAKSGAGNVTVSVPNSAAVRIHASTGLGSVIVDPRFDKIDGSTYQSPDYDGAADKIEITLESGAGNVSVTTY